MTVFFKKIENEEIYGLLIHDRSIKDNIKTYVAKKGFLDNKNGNNSIFLYDGTMQMYNQKEFKISEIDFDKYSIDLKAFDSTEKKFFYADEKSSVELINRISNKKHNSEEFAVLHNRFIKSLYIFYLVFLPLIIFKMIRKPDDNSRYIITTVIIIGIGIKFFEITMESILMENNNLLLINYISPIIILMIIVSLLFININMIKEKLRR